MKSGNFFGELKRRNVYKVAVAYIVAGWALAQGIAQVFPVFDVPNWAIRLIVILIIIGFPVALVLSWAFEITPEGIKRTEDVDVKQPHTIGGAWIYIAVLGALISVALFFLGRYTAREKLGLRRTLNPSQESHRNRSRCCRCLMKAVIQRTNIFGWLSEELIAALAQIAELKVIGRSSSFRFKDRKEEPKTIGEKLGVSTLLEGTVRKQGNGCESWPN